MTPTWIAASFVLLALLVGIVIGAMISRSVMPLYSRISDDGKHLSHFVSWDGCNWYRYAKQKRVDPLAVTSVEIQDGTR